MATKDKGGSKIRKKAPTKTLKQKRPSGRDCEVVRRMRVDDTARASRAAPQGSRHARVVAIRVLGLSRLT